MNLADRFYTSTEVAEILGVSLRSVYRYLEEGKLDAEVKTATGRHRFTKQNILDFLYPDGVKSSPRDLVEDEDENQTAKTNNVKTNVRVDEDADLEKTRYEEMPEPQSDVEEEEIDWLAKFRAAAEKYREAKEKAEPMIEEPKSEAPQPQQIEKEYLSSLASAPQPQEPETVLKPEIKEEQQIFYYQSNVGGLKELAQYINSTARKSSVPYAFTMNAGLSLHKLIRPFSILHIYVKPEDRAFFEMALELTGSDRNSAQLGIMLSRSVFDSVKEIHGLYVVSDVQLRKDLLDAGELDLAGELDEALNL